MSHNIGPTPKWTDHPMFDLHPSFLEVQAAKNVFKKRLSSFADDANCGTMRPKTAVDCALAEVWRQGRKYHQGAWSYQGRTYPTLREALAAVWPT